MFFYKKKGQNFIFNQLNTIKNLSKSLEPLINDFEETDETKRAVEDLIFSNFLKTFEITEFSEFSSQILKLWGERKTKILPPAFIKPAVLNNIKIHQYAESEGFIENKGIEISSSSNLAMSLENSARAGYGADMISRQFYTNDLKDFNLEEKEPVKTNFEDVFADFKQDNIVKPFPVDKKLSSEFENFLELGNSNNNNDNIMNNNRVKEESYFFDDQHKAFVHENSFHNQATNPLSLFQDDKKNSNPMDFFQDNAIKKESNNNNYNPADFFQQANNNKPMDPLEDNNKNYNNFLGAFDNTGGDKNIFDASNLLINSNFQNNQFQPDIFNNFQNNQNSRNSKEINKQKTNPFEQEEEKKNNAINLDDFGDFNDKSNSNSIMENSQTEIKHALEMNDIPKKTINNFQNNQNTRNSKEFIKENTNPFEQQEVKENNAINLDDFGDFKDKSNSIIEDSQTEIKHALERSEYIPNMNNIVQKPINNHQNARNSKEIIKEHNNPFEKEEEKKNNAINLDDFGDFKDNTNSNIENSQTEIKHALEMNDNNPFINNFVQKPIENSNINNNNVNLMDFWEVKKEEEPQVKIPDNNVIISQKSKEKNVITEDLFDNFQDYKSEKSSQNQENSTEFYYNNAKNNEENQIPVQMIPNSLKNSEVIENSNEKPSENKIDFWENLKITQQFQKKSVINLNPNQGVNILEKYENMQRTPSSLHRGGSFEEEDFRQIMSPVINQEFYSKNEDLVENKPVSFRFLQKQELENKPNSKREIKFEENKEIDYLDNNENKGGSKKSIKLMNPILEKEEMSSENKQVSSKFLKKKSEENNQIQMVEKKEDWGNNFNFEGMSPILVETTQKTGNQFYGETSLNQPNEPISGGNKNSWENDFDFLMNQNNSVNKKYEGFSTNFENIDTARKNSEINEEKEKNILLLEPQKSDALKNEKKIQNNQNIPEIVNLLDNNKKFDEFNSLFQVPNVQIANSNTLVTSNPFDYIDFSQSRPEQVTNMNFIDDFFSDPAKNNSRNSDHSIEKGNLNIDPNNIDKNNNLIIFTDQNSDDRKTVELNNNNNEIFLDFPDISDDHQKISDPSQDVFQDFKKVTFSENELIEEEKDNSEKNLKPIKITNSLRSNEFAVKQELASIQEVNEEHDISIKHDENPLIFSLNHKEIEGLINENKKIKEEVNNLKVLKSDFIESKITTQRNEEKINSILKDFQSLKSENDKIIKITVNNEINKKPPEIPINLNDNKFNNLEKNLQEMKIIYEGIKKEQENIKNDIKQTLSKENIQEKNASLKDFEENLKEINQKCQNTEAISSQNVTKLASDIEALQMQQKDLESGYKQNLKNFEVLFDSTKKLLNKVEFDKLPLHKELSNELKRNENEFDKTQENYSSLRSELMNVLQEFQKEVEVIKIDRMQDYKDINQKIVEYQEISKQKLTSIENTVTNFKLQFEGLKDFYEVLQKDITKITKLITLDQELSKTRVSMTKSEAVPPNEPPVRDSNSMEKTINITESPQKRSNKVTSSVFNISITPPKSDKKNETIKKYVRNETNNNSDDFNKREILNNSKISLTDFKEKQRTMSSKHNIMISPIRNNPLDNIEKFCNEFNQQEPLDREQFLKETYKGNQHFKQVWQDPYSILKEYEEKTQNSVYNFNGEVNISINNNPNTYNNNNSLSYNNYKTTYGNNKYSSSLGNMKNPNFYLCQDKFKRKILYVNKKSLSKLIKRMNTASAIFKIDVKNFKKSCLGSSTILFNNNEIQIGSKTSVQGNQIRIDLFISNKSRFVLNYFCLKIQSRMKDLRSLI